MCGFLPISKEMLIENSYLIVHAHKSRKRTIQSWIAITQKWAMVFIHNAVKKMHRRNWGHTLRWRHNKHGGFSNHQPYDGLLNWCGVVVRSTGAYEKLSSHPARPVLGWVARVEYQVPSHYTCQAVQSGYRESISWLSTVLPKRRKIEVPPTWCSMLGGVKDTTQGLKV